MYEPGEMDVQIIGYLAQNWTYGEAADALGVTKRVVARKVAQLTRDLGARNKIDLVVTAVRRGWL